jgi:hypothetical protein
MVCRVFVVGVDQDVEGDSPDPHQYWKAEVLEIRNSKTFGPWILVKWFYSPTQMAELQGSAPR